jgi:hypothetical protein
MAKSNDGVQALPTSSGTTAAKVATTTETTAKTSTATAETAATPAAAGATAPTTASRITQIAKDAAPQKRLEQSSSATSTTARR